MGRSEGSVWPEGGLCDIWDKKPLEALMVGRSQNQIYNVEASVWLLEEGEGEGEKGGLWERGAVSGAAQCSCL